MTDDEAVYVHPTATVEDGAAIGASTKLWHHAHVRAGASIGSGCVIGKNVFVDTGAVIGDGAKVQNNVSVYNGVSIGDDVFVGPSAVFTNDRVPRARGAWEIVPTVIRNGSSIGANATIICGVTIGAGAMVAAGAVVVKDVGPNEVVAGNPARRLGWVCSCGKTLVKTSGQRPLLDCPSCAGASA